VLVQWCSWCSTFCFCSVAHTAGLSAHLQVIRVQVPSVCWEGAEMSLFAIRCGGSGAKVGAAAVVAISMPAGSAPVMRSIQPRGSAPVLVEPISRAPLRARAQTAMDRLRTEMRSLLGNKAEHFARGGGCATTHLEPAGNASGSHSFGSVCSQSRGCGPGQWPGRAFRLPVAPPESKALSSNCGFRDGRQSGFRRHEAGSACEAKPKTVCSGNRCFSDIQAAGRWLRGHFNHPTLSIGSVFVGGTGSQGVPHLGQMLQTWSLSLGLTRVRVQCLHCFAALFRLRGPGQEARVSRE